MTDREIIATALDWARSGKRVALATVIATWGSSPRATGSRLAVDQDGRFIGSVSGGCVEGEILATAEEVIASGRPALREFGVSNEKAWSVGLACGGAIRIFVERIEECDFLQSLIEDAGAGRDAATTLALDSGERIRFDRDSAPEAWDDLTRHAISTAAEKGDDALVETPRGLFFVELWRAPLRLAIVGAVHIAQALAPIAILAGYQVTVIDPRRAFADAARFPGARILAAWPDEALPDFRLDSRTALVALSHEPRIDDPALIAALRSPAFYIGSLGSRGSAERRRARLRAQGVDDEALARIHGPIGLAIGAATPAEIAIAIAAELTGALRLAPKAALRSAAE
ncbi:XdhC family protein [Rhodoblastus sp. 17X3]|uniref:XdhC family protein n=1 Tax=Rhodoblastus sp. 17X3 TaxID=3047026 RepID=UPI0024B791DB|nr:XdhC family protein [Rhodoblastus sp. 17X3]MDI9847788.1 XdhC family protein [Rhodoblastus sp. 17X3]